ncbi:MAG: Eco57I restriction-modification methylase domain-containing protein [Bacteroidota bacterium]
MDQLAAGDAGSRGAVYTKPEVVNFVLDLAGYTPDHDLADCRLLEPSFGSGEFLFEAVRRLVKSFEMNGGELRKSSEHLQDSVRAVEISKESVLEVRAGLAELLGELGVPVGQSRELLDSWIIQDDFLLTDLPRVFSHVVGNPPYVRSERVPRALMAEYRSRYLTMYDRSDLYVPFFERGLDLLEAQGILSFVCADRWMKNRYGALLRQKIAGGYHLEAVVDFSQVDAFDSNVSAYPSVVAIRRSTRGENSLGPTLNVPAESVKLSDLGKLASELRSDETDPPSGSRYHAIVGVAKGREPWILDAPQDLALLRRLEAEFPPLESVGCRVGIGVATGADAVFIRHREEIDIETTRQLPIAMASDVTETGVQWSNKVLANPYEHSGQLVDLKRYPKLSRYLQAHKERLRSRHVARKQPHRWYKTIDRVWADLTTRPKLLIPDIKGAARVGYDDGKLYPHHNLYYVVSESPKGWDLHALQAVLRSCVAEFMVSMYCVKMRGGYLRFQAQYLRRICLPAWETLEKSLQQRLVEASKKPRDVCDSVALELFGITSSESEILESYRK